MEDGVCNVEHRAPEDHAGKLDHKVDEGGTLAVDVCADGGDQDRHGSADGDAHDDGQSRCKVDHARGGQRLHDTDCRRCALNDGGEDGAEQDAEQRV